VALPPTIISLFDVNPNRAKRPSTTTPDFDIIEMDSEAARVEEQRAIKRRPVDVLSRTAVTTINCGDEHILIAKQVKVRIRYLFWFYHTTPYYFPPNLEPG
jgi:hypothetical protein